MIDEEQFHKSLDSFDYAINHVKDGASHIFQAGSRFSKVKNDDYAQALSDVMEALSKFLDAVASYAESDEDVYEGNDPARYIGSGNHDYLIGIDFKNATIRVRADDEKDAMKRARQLIKGQDIIHGDFEFSQMRIDDEDSSHSIKDGELAD